MGTRDELSFDEWRDTLRRLLRMGRSWQFWTGDALIYGETRWPDRYAGVPELADLTGLEYSTLANACRVARQIPPGRCRPGLSYSHHLMVAALPPAHQDEWLDRAEAEGLTVQRLRSKVNAYRASVEKAAAALEAGDEPPPVLRSYAGVLHVTFGAESDEAERTTLRAAAQTLRMKAINVTVSGPTEA